MNIDEAKKIYCEGRAWVENRKFPSPNVSPEAFHSAFDSLPWVSKVKLSGMFSNIKESAQNHKFVPWSEERDMEFKMQFDVDYLHMMGILDHYEEQQRTPEERMQQAWLDRCFS